MDLTFKLGDIYDGYSKTTTREMSLPSGASAEKLNNGEANKQAEQIVETTTSNTSKASIFGAVAVIVIVGVVLGALR